MVVLETKWFFIQLAWYVLQWCSISSKFNRSNLRSQVFSTAVEVTLKYRVSSCPQLCLNTYNKLREYNYTPYNILQQSVHFSNQKKCFITKFYFSFDLSEGYGLKFCKGLYKPNTRWRKDRWNRKRAENFNHTRFGPSASSVFVGDNK